MRTNNRKFLALSIALLAVMLLPQVLLAEGYSPNCVSRASAKCISNILYWHNSCGALESIKQNCNTTGQVCQNGACISQQQQPPINSGGTPAIQQNSCLFYSCQGTACANVLKCDGSTCPAGSADYTNYCGSWYAENQANQQYQSGALATSIFVTQQEDSALHWTKNPNVAPGDKVTFLVVIKNTADVPTNNLSVKVDISEKISYVGDLKIDNTDFTGNVGTGIDIGALAPKTSKSMVFSGQVKDDAPLTLINVLLTVNSMGYSDSDSLVVNVQSESQENSSNQSFFSWLGDFLKEQYIWVIIVIVLVVLFVILYRRFSSNV